MSDLAVLNEAAQLLSEATGHRRRFSPHGDYRPTMIPGLTRLPTHWRSKPLKHLARLNPEELPNSTDPDYRLEYVDISSVDHLNGIVNVESFRFEDAPSRARRRVQHGDTIISTVRTYLKAVAKIEDPPENRIVSTGFAVLRPGREIDPGFLYRAVQSEEFVGRVVAYSTGVSYPAIAPSLLGTFELPLPPLDEQRAIAAFLRRETAKIDALVAKKRRLIELLQEKRTALISRAVTKGLNPDAPTKPSGIDWLGDVPAHWDISRLKFSVSKIGSGKTPKGGSQVYVTAGVMLLRSQNVYDDGLRLDDVVFITEETDDEMSGTRVAPGDVLLNITGASIGRCGLVPQEFLPANVNQHVCIIRPRTMRSAFLHAVLCSKGIKDWISAEENGTSREGLNFRQVGNIALPTPPFEEQDQIIQLLSEKTARIDRLVARVQSVIERLVEYRSVIVSAAVTGQIDVRTAAGEEAAA